MRARNVLSRLVTTVTPGTRVKYAANPLAFRGFTTLPGWWTTTNADCGGIG